MTGCYSLTVSVQVHLPDDPHTNIFPPRVKKNKILIFVVRKKKLTSVTKNNSWSFFSEVIVPIVGTDSGVPWGRRAHGDYRASMETAEHPYSERPLA